MKTGKLTIRELKENVLDIIKVRRKQTVLSASLGEDCAVIRSEGLLFLTCDPITATMGGANIGALAVQVSCNDIAACGAEPIAVLLTVIMPTDSSAGDVKTIMQQAEAAAVENNVDIVGGHTEFSTAVIRPVVCATVVGVADKIIRSDQAKPGDSIIVTKYIGLEGTGILAAEFSGQLQLSIIEQDIAAALGKNISVLTESTCLKDTEVVMHDITEGGVFGAVSEVCAASNVGAELFVESIPLHEVTAKICSRLSIDPYKLLSSGSMLIMAAAPDRIIEKLSALGINAAVVGKVVEGGGVTAIYGDGRREAVDAGADEITKIIDRTDDKQ